MDYGIIYCAFNKKNGKRYIGQTIHDLDKRRRHHYSKYSGCSYFSKALQKYNKEDWEWSVIDKASSREELNEKEKYWIKFYKTTIREFGYNLTEGG